MKTSIPLSICVLLIACTALLAQDKKKSGFDVSKFLKRLDTNQNGKVEPSEVKDDRTRGFLKKAGVDTSKSISIAGFSKKIEKQKKARRNTVSGQKSSGFFVDRDEPGNTLAFSVTDEERAPIAKSSGRSRSYSEGATKMMEWTLKKYDKNKDGKLDANEIKSGRWSDPSAKDSDKNRDGNLSRNELLARYQDREDEKAKSKKRSSRRTSSSRSSARSRDSKSKTDSRKRSSDSKSSKDRSGSDRGKRDVRKGYESYVDGLFKSYDKNKNGQLEKDEIEKMRKKPDMKADENKDKQISKSELLNSYLEKAGVKTGSGKSEKKSDKRSGSRKESSSSSNANARPQLTSKDKNKNGQIEMAEFASEWTLSKVEEFYEKDKNRDGIITASEWNAK